MRTTSTHEARGNGAVTVTELIEALNGFPPDAYLRKVEIGDSQRDGSWWHILAVETHER